jgi:ABC-type nitrate/sulfonate/bicarbonate transport system permease component
LPSPLAVAREMAAVFPELWRHTMATVKITVAGFAVAAATGIGLSVLLHAVAPVLRRPVYPLLVVTQTVPTIAIAPLIVFWLGYGILPKVVIITLVCFFPILVSTLQGYANTDPTMRNYMLMIGASRWQLFRRLEWPSALPFLFAGLRVATAYSVIGAVIAEWLGAQYGLGIAIRLYASTFNVARMFACIVMIVAFSLLFFALVVLLEKRMIRWRPAGKERP